MSDVNTTDNLSCVSSDENIVYVHADPDGRYCQYRPDEDTLTFGVHVADAEDDLHGTLQFQNGNPKTEGINGTTNEMVIRGVVARLEHLDAEYPHEENKVAIDHLKLSIDALDRRMADPNRAK